MEHVFDNKFKFEIQSHTLYDKIITRTNVIFAHYHYEIEQTRQELPVVVRMVLFVR